MEQDISPRKVRRKFKRAFSYRNDGYEAQADDIETVDARKKTNDWSSDVVLIEKGWRQCGLNKRYIDYVESQYYDESKIDYYGKKILVYRFDQLGSDLPTAVDSSIITTLSESVFDCDMKRVMGNMYQVDARVMRSLGCSSDEKTMLLLSLPDQLFDVLIEPIRYYKSDHIIWTKS